MEKKNVLFDEVLPGNLSIYDPLLKDQFPNLIKFYEEKKKIDELFRTINNEKPKFQPSCSLHANFTLSLTGIPPFVEPLNNPILFRMATIFAYGRQLQNNTKGEVCRIVCAVGELLASDMKSQHTNQSNARIYLVEIVKKLICSSSLKTVTALKMEDIEKARSCGAPFKSEDISNWSKSLPLSKTTFTSDNSILTPEAAMSLLELMAIHSEQILKDEIIILISHLQLALVSQEDDDPSFICDVADFLARERQTVINEDLITALRVTYYEKCNSKIAFRVFADWSTIFPGDDSRVRRSYKEALRAKLICLYSIRQAFLSFPGFYWEQLCSVPEYGHEILNVAEAIRTLVDDPFCSFDKKNYPSIDSNQFPNFASACRDLLVRCKRRAYLLSYDDFLTIPAHEDFVTELIERYCISRKEEKFKGKLPKNVALAIKEVKEMLLTGKS